MPIWGGWLSGHRDRIWRRKADPLLTQAPTKGLVEPDMPGGDDLAGARVADQVGVGVSRVSYEDALESSVGHFAGLMLGNVDICWAAKDAKVARVWCAATRERQWDTIDTPVVCPVVEITSGHGSEFPVACR